MRDYSRYPPSLPDLQRPENLVWQIQKFWGTCWMSFVIPPRRSCFLPKYRAQDIHQSSEQHQNHTRTFMNFAGFIKIPRSDRYIEGLAPGREGVLQRQLSPGTPGQRMAWQRCLCWGAGEVLGSPALCSEEEERALLLLPSPHLLTFSLRHVGRKQQGTGHQDQHPASADQSTEGQAPGRAVASSQRESECPLTLAGCSTATGPPALPRPRPRCCPAQEAARHRHCLENELSSCCRTD